MPDPALDMTTSQDAIIEPAESTPVETPSRTPAPIRRTFVDDSSHVMPKMYMTAAIAGIGGVIKARPEDFLVDEMPMYQPSGSGEHIYLLAQKRGMSTFEMIEVIARHFGVTREAIGTAGLKDKHAITRQVVSVHTPGKTGTDFPMLTHERISILWVDQHNNKLRRGHLKGNRFSIRIREVTPTSVLQANKSLQLLSTQGMPNRFGAQRFGLLGNNHLVGRDLLIGDYHGACRRILAPDAAHPLINPASRAAFALAEQTVPGDAQREHYAKALESMPHGAKAERRILQGLSHGKNAKNAIMSVDRRTLSFFVSAFQSAVFNATLDERIEQGLFQTFLPGDIAMKLDNRATFEVTPAIAGDAQLVSRITGFEISPTGPMWGPKMRRCKGEIDELELRVLARFGVVPEDFEKAHRDIRGSMEGDRRALRVPLISPEIESGVDDLGAFVRCAFELPRGSFATVAMGEVMKNAVPVESAAVDSDEPVED